MSLGFDSKAHQTYAAARMGADFAAVDDVAIAEVQGVTLTTVAVVTTRCRR